MRRPTEDEIVAALLDAYRQGAFPMADLPPASARRAFTDPRRAARGGRAPTASGPLPVAESISWYSPDPRAVLPLEDGRLLVPSGVARTIRKAGFVITADRCFEGVMRACAEPAPGRGGMWIDETLVRLYTLLHRRGHAHSVEAWLPRRDPPTGPPHTGTGSQPVAGAPGPEQCGPSPASPALTPVGGLYGVSLGAAFFAESMFSRLDHGGSGASSACLVALWRHLRARGYQLLDVQIANDHTRRFGVVEIPRAEYLARLGRALAKADAWAPMH